MNPPLSFFKVLYYRIMPLLLEHEIVPLTIQHLNAFSSRFASNDLLVAAEALSNIIDSEDFQTQDVRMSIIKLFLFFNFWIGMLHGLNYC